MQARVFIGVIMSSAGSNMSVYMMIARKTMCGFYIYRCLYICSLYIYIYIQLHTYTRAH